MAVVFLLFDSLREKSQCPRLNSHVLHVSKILAAHQLKNAVVIKEKGENYLLVYSENNLLETTSSEVTRTSKFAFNLEFVISNGGTNSAVTQKTGGQTQLKVMCLNTMIIPCYPWFCFPWFQVPRLNHSLKILNGKFQK